MRDRNNKVMEKTEKATPKSIIFLVAIFDGDGGEKHELMLRELGANMYERIQDGAKFLIVHDVASQADVEALQQRHEADVCAICMDSFTCDSSTYSEEHEEDAELLIAFEKQICRGIGNDNLYKNAFVLTRMRLTALYHKQVMDVLKEAGNFCLVLADANDMVRMDSAVARSTSSCVEFYSDKCAQAKGGAFETAEYVLGGGVIVPWLVFIEFKEALLSAFRTTTDWLSTVVLKRRGRGLPELQDVGIQSEPGKALRMFDQTLLSIALSKIKEKTNMTMVKWRDADKCWYNEDKDPELTTPRVPPPGKKRCVK